MAAPLRARSRSYQDHHTLQLSDQCERADTVVVVLSKLVVVVRNRNHLDGTTRVQHGVRRQACYPYPRHSLE